MMIIYMFLLLGLIPFGEKFFSPLSTNFPRTKHLIFEQDVTLVPPFERA